MTQREYEARLSWINKDLEQPSRSDWYLMQIAAEVRRNRVDKPELVKLNDMKLASEKEKKAKEEKPKKIDPIALAISKSRWGGLVGLKRGKQ